MNFVKHVVCSASSTVFIDEASVGDSRELRATGKKFELKHELARKLLGSLSSSLLKTLKEQTCKMSETLPEQDFHFQILPERA